MQIIYNYLIKLHKCIIISNFEITLIYNGVFKEYVSNTHLIFCVAHYIS